MQTQALLQQSLDTIEAQLKADLHVQELLHAAWEIANGSA